MVASAGREALSVVVAVFNSEQTISPLVTELHRELPRLCDEFEIIFVNDCSRDGSWRIVADLVSRDPAVRGINLMRNYGQHNAVLAGVRAARHDIIVTMDDDLQHPPREIHKLLAELCDDTDVVYGVPEREPQNLWRNLASQATKIVLAGAMGAETARNISAFRAFRTGLREAFSTFSGPFVSVDVLLTWATTRFTSVKVVHEPRRVGVSNYTVRKLVVHAINLITGFSVVPLQIASVVGFAFTLLGIFVLLYILIVLILMGRQVPGFAFLGSIIAIFSGAQLFAIGVIGEYLARIHFRTMNRPPYAVREQIGATDANRALREPTGPLNLTTPGNRSADGAPRARSAKTG
jgi:undecaprenyl-phosphate 4-deoxy-4-formamido-L-arabinose transferase